MKTFKIVLLLNLACIQLALYGNGSDSAISKTGGVAGKFF